MGKLTGIVKTVAVGGVAAVWVWGALGDFALFGGKTATSRLGGASAQTDALESPRNFKAFLVGADDYDDAPELPDLDFVRNDVESMAARLVEIGFKKKNVVVLKTGGDFRFFPTKKIIDKRYKEFLDSLREGDFVLVYLSGHGLQATDSEEAFFAPIDVESDDWFGSSVSIDKMPTLLDESGARFRWMIVDACRNDPEKGQKKAIGAKGLANIVNAPETTALLQSCRRGEAAYGVNGVSVFTWSLLEALDEKNLPADSDADGTTTFSEILEYVSSRTDELAQKHFGEPQEPNVSGEIPDFVILARVEDDSTREASSRFPLIDVTIIGAVLIWWWRFKKKKGPEPKKPTETPETPETTATPKDGEEEPENEADRGIIMTATALRGLKEGWRKRWIGATAEERRWIGATPGVRRSFEVRGIRYDFRRCPPGDFWMGSPESEAGREEEETLRNVKVERGFWTLETPVTQRMWESIMGADASWASVGSNPSWFSATGAGKDKILDVKDALNLPVDSVSWYDCQNFIRTLNNIAFIPKEWKLRLPSEIEWEYACRAGTSAPFFWGDTLNGVEANCNGNYPYDSKGTSSEKPGPFLGRPSETRSYEPNPWGGVRYARKRLRVVRGRAFGICVGRNGERREASFTRRRLGRRRR